MVEKGKVTAADASAARARITTSAEVVALAGCDLVIEAATENVDLKFRIFEACRRVVRPGALLASNTSSISITAIAAHTDRPDQVMGMHFMNPVPVMKLVELIRGLATSDETFAAVKAAAEKHGQDHGPRPRHARASSSTACSCRTSTRRSTRSTRASARSRTSTPP
jgi:3-hydroxybutyryl-CoA dehydrogenase